MTCKKSRNCCFFKYFLVKYFKYLLENGSSALTEIFDFSRLILTLSPKFPVFPLTLILSLKNCSNLDGSMMLSRTGCSQSTTKVVTTFLALEAVFFLCCYFCDHCKLIRR